MYDVIVSQKNCPSSKTWVLTQFYAVNFNIFNELLCRNTRLELVDFFTYHSKISLYVLPLSKRVQM